MSKMIPSHISPEVKSNAERRMYDLFKNTPGTEGWVVFHSLGISNHNKLIYGEIDFVVAAPGLGVFALEVKGGRVKREEGKWYFTNKYGVTNSKVRGPFEQAKDGIFSLFNEIKNRIGTRSKLSNLMFGFGVMFPDIEYIVDDLDSEKWQVFDKRDSDLVSFIKKISKNTIRKWEDKYGNMPSSKLPTRKDIKELTQLIRKDFDFPVTLDTQLKMTENQMNNFTVEQLRCLDQLEDNSRILVNGRAGTGKTLIAVEETKRSVAQGEKVALFCYNSKLSVWLKSYFENIPEALRPCYVGTFHSFMIDLLENKKLENYDFCDHDFYKQDLPIMVMEKLDECGLSFDKIIIDEAQDLLIPEYLDVIDDLLKNGIDRGRWSFYGDFEMQNIFNSHGFQNEHNGIEQLESLTSFIKFRLNINCRNTKQIDDEVHFLVEIDKLGRCLKDIDGPPVDYLVYKSVNEQQEKLNSILNNLINEQKIEPSCITILSPKKFEESVVSKLNSKYIHDQYPTTKQNNVQFSTIHSFKGLENSIIILCDIETLKNKALLYVGLSRAKSKLYILESQGAYKERKDILRRSIV